ncbi:MAG: metallophosphoesterase family protein [Thermodesulfobacteriota bacterium]
MRIAVLSDIHGNMDAFESVLSDIASKRVDQIISLGDMIGYGAQPEPVIAEIRSRRIVTIMGNHELAVVKRKYMSWFNPQARQSLTQTIDMLSPDSIRFLSRLNHFHHQDSFYFVHGYPPDSPLTYLFQVSEERMMKTFHETDFQIFFVGHTHILELIRFNRNGFSRSLLAEGMVRLQPDSRYIVNIGSVGQPRDGNICAKYGILDSRAHTLDIRFIPYDFRSAADKIIAAGLPPGHARRLMN